MTTDAIVQRAIPRFIATTTILRSLKLLVDRAASVEPKADYSLQSYCTQTNARLCSAKLRQVFKYNGKLIDSL